MFSEIHQLRQIGLKRAQAARKLQINVKTVSKYWGKTPDEFAAMRRASKRRSRKLRHYEDVILKWIQENPDMSCGQIRDWLKEYYRDYSVQERTLRRYVSELRKKYGVVKPVVTREYQAVADLPAGRQLQVDFGEKRVRNTGGGYTKLYVMGTVLAYSRYKYGEWSEKPLTTSMFIRMLRGCFEHLGGVPSELVFDQDRLIAVSENYGDIIYTHEFERFKQAMGFDVYLCRRGDPESKGKIESVIKYIKKNFASHRLYTDIRSWNQSLQEWLKRTANYNPHGTTKRVPAEAFEEERQYLKPLVESSIIEEDETRMVHKDNTVLYKGNRYSVPLGTYRPQMTMTVRVREEGGNLSLWDATSDELVAKHSLCMRKGQLIQKRNHCRDYSVKIEELYEETLVLLGGGDQAATFLRGIHREKTRYTRDQFKLLEKLTLKHSAEVIREAIGYCLERGMYSAVDCRDVAVWLDEQGSNDSESAGIGEIGTIPGWMKVRAEKRDITTAYKHLAGGGV